MQNGKHSTVAPSAPRELGCSHLSKCTRQEGQQNALRDAQQHEEDIQAVQLVKEMVLSSRRKSAKSLGTVTRGSWGPAGSSGLAGGAWVWEAWDPPRSGAGPWGTWWSLGVGGGTMQLKSPTRVKSEVLI